MSTLSASYWFSASPIAWAFGCLGRSSISGPPDPPATDAAELAAQDKDAAKSETPSRRVRRGRRDLGADAFAQLPVTRHEHDLAEDQKPCRCCGKVHERIGEDVTWQLEHIPGHFERLEHVRF